MSEPLKLMHEPVDVVELDDLTNLRKFVPIERAEHAGTDRDEAIELLPVPST